MILFLSILLACVEEGEEVDPTCKSICDTLVYACDYAAFPTYDSCVEGCLFSGKEGGDNAEYESCLEGAVENNNECDTFKVVECENAYGIESGSADE